MKIAQVAPLIESVPPRLYGGTERVVSYLTEELVRAGHEVTLFAAGDSRTRAELRPITPEALRLSPQGSNPLIPHIVMLEQVFKAAAEFDILHFHVDYLHFPLSRRHRHPNVTTLHGRLDLPDFVMLYREFPEVSVVSISEAQRRPLPWVNWQATVYNGLPLDLYSFNPNPEGYLAFLGRLSPEKRPDRAIEIARRAGMPLKIAAKVDRADRDYFENRIRPLLGGGGVEFLGEINEAEKGTFLGNASALLFPIDWPEPFGLVMVEAMACGTPVIAFRRGSVPEVMIEGVTGFIVDVEDAAAQAVDRLSSIDRRACRKAFETRFSAERMALDYLAVYRKILRGHHFDESNRPPVN